MKRCAIVLLALVTQLSPIQGLQPENERVAALYRRGLAGDAAAVRDCIAMLESILAIDPENQLARAYLGSAYTLRSRDLGLGPEKLRSLRKGIALMDTAAGAAPENARVRLVRALTNESLPFFVRRQKLARDEFYALVEIVQRDPGKLPANDQQLLYLNAGLTARREGNKEKAIKLWRLGLTKAADPKLTAELHAALAKL